MGELTAEIYASEIDTHPPFCSDTIAEGKVYRFSRKNTGAGTRSESTKSLVDFLKAGEGYRTGGNGEDRWYLERPISIIRMLGVRKRCV